MEPVVMAVDVDHALAGLADAVIAWHNPEAGEELQVDGIGPKDWDRVWNRAGEDTVAAFFASTQFTTDVGIVPDAAVVLKPLRKYFSLVAVTDRPRSVEKATREWLDAHCGGVFDKLVFVDEDSREHLVARKKELYHELKVQIAVGADPAVLVPASEAVDYAVLVGSVPWAGERPGFHPKIRTAADWAAASDIFAQIIQEMGLAPAERAASGPKLARHTDDLVTVSMRKPAVFYANIINAKFVHQKQETIRLQASEGAITTAVQTAEILCAQKTATTAKIATRYVINRPKERGGYRVPKIELVLQRVERKP